MKYRILFFCLFIFFVFIQSIDVKNPDRPEKGEWSFSPRQQWATDSAGNDILTDVQEIRLDEKGNIFILDSRLNKVHVINPDGKYLFSFGKKGEGPGEIKQTWGMFLIDHQVIIPDMGKIHYFSREGKHLKSIPAPLMFISYRFLDDNRVLAVPFSSFRKEQREVWLYNLKTKEQKILFQIPQLKALRWTGEGSRLMLRMPFEVAEDLVIANYPGQPWYGYNDTYKIQRLDLNKKDAISFSLDGRKREKLSPQSKQKMFERVLENQREIPKNVLNKMADQIPDEIPCFHHLVLDKKGFIYILTATGQYPNRRKVDIFSPRGKYLYRGLIELKKGCSIIRLAMHDKDLVTFLEDSEGERKLVKYTLKIPSN